MNPLSNKIHLERETHFALLAAVTVSVLLLGLHFFWLKIDNQLLPIIDEYVLKIANLSNEFQRHPIIEAPRSLFWSTIGPRTFLYQLFGSVTFTAFGQSVDAILIVNLIFKFILSITCYVCATYIVNKRVAVLATLFVLTFPFEVETTRIVRPHYIVSTIYALSLLILFKNQDQRRLRNIIYMSCLSLVAFLIHPSSTFVIASINLIFVYQSVIGFRGKALSNFNSTAFITNILCFGIAFIVMSAWVVIKWDQMIGMYKVGQEIFVPMYTPLQIFIDTPKILGYLGALYLAGSLYWYFSSFRSNTSHTHLFFACLALSYILFHLTHSVTEWSNFASVIPAIAIACTYFLDRTYRALDTLKPAYGNLLKIGLTATTIMVCAGTFAHHGWGVNILGFSQCSDKTNFCDVNLNRSKSPLSGSWHQKDVFGHILNDPKCQTNCKVTLVSHRPMYFSDEALTYQMVLNFPNKSKVDDGSFYPNRKVQIKRLVAIEDLKVSQFSIFLLNQDKTVLKVPVGKGASDQEADAINMILSSPAAFQKEIERKLPNGQYLLMYSHRT